MLKRTTGRSSNRVFLVCLAAIILGCSQISLSGLTEGETIIPPQAIPSEAVYPLKNDGDLDVLLKEIGDSKIVLLGEASHGTSEFYTWRARLSQRLIREKGFTLIAVEGDWTDALPLNNYIKGNSTYSSAEKALQHFDRWPSWMWANREMVVLGEWLKEYNSGRRGQQQINFYGLDVYGLSESIEAVDLYLRKTDPAAAKSSQAVLDCFASYNEDWSAYARATLTSTSCEEEINDMLAAVEKAVGDQDSLTGPEFSALQNAIVVANGETYYRTAAKSNAASWNVRDLHMTGTINRLLEQHGPEAKMIVWEHNSHVGDARATNMKDAGIVNVGQLVREQYGEENVYIVGFGFYSGEVIAAKSWGAARKVMEVPPAQQNSWEWILHAHGPEDKIILMNPLRTQPEFRQRIGHRAIGVVYDPRRETGNYVPSILPERYDAFIFLDQTEALRPLRK